MKSAEIGNYRQTQNTSFKSGSKALAERALSTEMDVHLDEERAEEAPEGQNQPSNRRNGRSQKTVTTDSGKVVLDIPRVVSREVV
jgi:transposase-like protein